MSLSPFIVASLVLNVVVLVAVVAGLAANARWTLEAYGPQTPARGILTSIYVAIGVASVVLLVRADAPGAPLWADLWNGPPFVIYGHTPRPEVHKLKWSLGIDTACAMGGHLTAFILPEKRFVQVKARQRYFP